jgi:hypothetical protein
MHMPETKWMLKGREFGHCNCAYGCPCQFNALPTYGDCKAIVGMQIDEGYHGSTRLDGLRTALVLAWPGPIHEGNGEASIIIDRRASAPQREALLRILSGQDTEPGATVFQVFSSTFTKVHDPIFADIDFEVDVNARKARLKVADLVEARGEPIINPVTGAEHRARFDMPNGFEFTIAEAGRGWGNTQGSIQLELKDSHAHFANLHLCQTGVIR